jgi:hypothetical protein
MFYSAPFTFNFATSLVLVDVGTTTVDVGALYDAAKLAQSSPEGLLHAGIAKGSGLVDLGNGVSVGLTVSLLGSWQIAFPAGAYIARVTGGNLVGGLDGDPIAYSAGVQVLLIQSANSTVVNLSGGDVAADVSQVRALAEADEVFDHATGLLHTYRRGTTVDLIPPKTVAGTAQSTDSSLRQ